MQTGRKKRLINLHNTESQQYNDNFRKFRFAALNLHALNGSRSERKVQRRLNHGGTADFQNGLRRVEESHQRT